MLNRLCIASNTRTDLRDAARAEDALPGDRQAFTELYQSTIKRVFSMVSRIVGNPHEAEDVTQSAYLQGYRSFHSFTGRASFFTWMYRVAMNVAIQYVRNRGRRNRNMALVPALDADPPALGASSDPGAALARRELYLALKSGIDLLPTSQRAVLVAGAIQGRSYREMARGLGLSEDIVKGRLHRARNNLRARLFEAVGVPDERPLKLAS